MSESGRKGSAKETEPSMYYTLDDEHNPIPCDSIDAWCEWFKLAARTGSGMVNITKIGNYTVSTVFLGVNYNWRRNSPGYRPLVFETMVFDESKNGESVDKWFNRYSTWDEAEAGHKKIYDEVNKEVKTNERTT